MKTETFKVYDDCWGVHKEGVAQIINGTTLVIMMEKPYYGLLWGEYFWMDTKEILREQFLGRAGFLLGRLYEHVMKVEEHCEVYKLIVRKTEKHEKKVRELSQDVIADKNVGVSDIDIKAKAFYLEALKQEVNHFYEEQTEHYNVPSISYQSVKDYLSVIELKCGNNNDECL